MVLAFINIIIYNKDKLINTNVKQMKTYKMKFKEWPFANYHIIRANNKINAKNKYCQSMGLNPLIHSEDIIFIN